MSLFSPLSIKSSLNRWSGSDQSRTGQTGLLAASSLSLSLLYFGATVILTHLLSIGQYADFRQIQLPFTFLIPLLTVGIPDTLFYFLPRQGERVRHIWSALAIICSAAILLMVCVLAGGAGWLADFFRNPGITRGFIVYGLFLALTLPSQIIRPILLTRNQGVLGYIGFSMLERGAPIACAALAAVFWQSVMAVLYALILGAIPALLLTLAILFSETRGHALRPQRSGVMEQLTKSTPLCLSSAIAILSRNLDKILVGSLLYEDKQIFAVYVLGAVELPVMNVIGESMRSVLMPNFSKLNNEANHAEMLLIWKRACAKAALIVFPIFVQAWILADWFFVTAYGTAYAGGAFIFRTYLFLLPIRIVNFSALFVACGETRKLLSRSLVGIISNLALSILLIKQLGAWGAALATVGMIYLWMVPYSIYIATPLLKATLRTMFPWKPLVQLMGICLTVALVQWALLEQLGISHPVLMLGSAGLGLLAIGAWFHFAGFINLHKYKSPREMLIGIRK